ncbi:MAG TPA: LamG-like jellyroll fold domain-containing protein [Verrucomicrobiae bacterium]|nr:LamG-like jellyroll fold domain-containing protein [Verrucomicrobiae bacterium]
MLLHLDAGVNPIGAAYNSGDAGIVGFVAEFDAAGLFVVDCNDGVLRNFGFFSRTIRASPIQGIAGRLAPVSDFAEDSMRYGACILAVFLCCLENVARATVGATMPFTSVEAESGLLGGGATVISLAAAPTNQFSSPQLEASGHAFVALTNVGQFVQLTNNTGSNITALNLRACIPDAPTGGGITSTIDLYVNGVFRQAWSVSSMQCYCYEGGTNYASTTDKNPADGDPRDFWNDTHAFISGGAVPPGGTIQFQFDSSNTAAFYYIDVVDMEAPPSPLAQPTNSLNILDYGAVSNNASVDNTTAINNCFKACRTSHKTAWIPQGTYYISAVSGGLNATGITIVGAGPWYSTIYRVTPANNPYGIANIIDANSCVMSNILFDCNATNRNGLDNDGAVDFAGTNWVVNNVWIQHVTSSFWCAGVNGIVENSRTLSTWADGGNLNNQQNGDGIGMNLVYSNNFIRGTGDDGMAINSVNYNVFGSQTNYYTIMSNITYVNNTAIDPWGGHNLSIYGGINIVLENNLLTDSSWETGLSVGQFGPNGSPTVSAIVTGNVLVRCGANCFNQRQAALGIWGAAANVYCASNIIVDSLYDGVGFGSSSNIVLESNTIVAPGENGIVIGPPFVTGSDVTGFAVLNFNTVTELTPGFSNYLNLAGDYVTGGIENNGFTVPGPLVSPWSGEDIGSVGTAGGASYSKETFTLVGSGAEIGRGADAFHYVYQPSSGNCGISAQVATEEVLYPGAKAGVMIRNSLDPADMEASVVATPGNGILFQWRGAYGGMTSNTTIPNLTAPCWLQLARDGNIFTASYSSNGTSWTVIGTGTTIPMATNVVIGLGVTSGQAGALCSSMFDNVTVVIPALEFSAVHWEGDLIANLQSSDLNAGSSVWTNRTSNANSVGNFSTVGKKGLSLTNTTWNSQAIKALLVNDTLANAVQSALATPAEIIGDSPVSAEAWIYAIAVSQQNSCVIGYGIQGGSSSPEEDREFDYSDPCCGGGVSGDFGSYDTPWKTTPASGAWHYLAWTYDGGTVRLYLDGELNTENSPSSPLQTPPTVIGVGAGIANGGPNLGADSFQGYIAAARLESGVLTAADIATNYALGPLAGAAAVTPAGLSATAGDGQVILTWDYAGNAASYDVTRATALNGLYTVIATNLTAPEFTNTGLSNGLTYYFAVSGVNSAGASSNSAPVAVQPVSLSPPVFNFAVIGGNLQLAWGQDHTGWTLQAQTNLQGEGISTNWVTIPGSFSTNQFTLPIGLAGGSVFVRLVYP